MTTARTSHPPSFSPNTQHRSLRHRTVAHAVGAALLVLFSSACAVRQPTQATTSAASPAATLTASQRPMATTITAPPPTLSSTSATSTITPTSSKTSAASTATQTPSTASSLGYLLVSAKEYGAVQVHNLAAGTYHHYPAITWAHGGETSLSSLIHENGWAAVRNTGNTLHLYRFPEEESRVELQLIGKDLYPPPSKSDDLPRTQIVAVNSTWASPRWSPEGSWVAFAAAKEDRWVNVYLHNTHSGETTRPAALEAHVLPLAWSPDGEQVVAVAGDHFQDNHYRPRALYVLDTTGSAPPRKIALDGRNPLQVLGWVSESRLVFATSRPDRGLENLRVLDTQQGTIQLLADVRIQGAAVSPAAQSVLVSREEAPGEDALVLYDLRTPGEMTSQSIPLEGETGGVRWLPSLNLYGVENRSGSALVAPDGSIRQIFPEERGLPFPSPDGQWIAFGPGEAFYDTDFHLYSTAGERIQTGQRGARDIQWWPDAKGLFFSMTGGKIALVNVQEMTIREVFHGNGWELDLVLPDAAPFQTVSRQVQALETPPPPPTIAPDEVTPEPTPALDPPLAPGTALTIREIDMKTRERGWALGRGPEDHFDRVLYTTDGGSTWQDVTPPKPQVPGEEELLSGAYGSRQRAEIYTLDESRAWVTYAAPQNLREVTVWRTADAGKTWQASDPVDIRALDQYGPWVSGYLPVAIHFTDAEVGWIQAITELPGLMMAADTILLRTEDGGQSWDFIRASSTTGPEGMFFLDRWQGWMLHTADQPDLSSILRTRDGGEHWYRDPDLPVGYPPDPLRSGDPCSGGYQMEGLPDQGLKMIVWCEDIQYDEEGNQINASTNHLYLSDDGGRTWRSRQLPVITEPGETFTTHFLNSRVGWLLTYRDGEMRQTVDGGQTWRTFSSVDWEGTLQFIDAQHGWAVTWEPGGSRFGPALVLQRTTDSGAHWDMLNPVLE